MAVCLHRKGFVPALVHRAGADRAPAAMPAFTVGASHRVHETSLRVVVGRPEHEVKVIRHDAVRQDSDRDASLGLAGAT